MHSEMTQVQGAGESGSEDLVTFTCWLPLRENWSLSDWPVGGLHRRVSADYVMKSIVRVWSVSVGGGTRGASWVGHLLDLLPPVAEA